MLQQNKTVADVPLDQIRDALTSTPEVIIRVGRQNSKGQWATVVSGVRKPTADLAQLDDWLIANAGGGKFRISAFDPKDTTREVVTAFIVDIEGQPRPPTFMDEQFAPGAIPPMGPGPAMHAPQPYMAPYQAPRPIAQPAWAGGLPPSQQAAFYGQQPSAYGPQPGFDPNHRYNMPMSRFTPDELAKATSDKYEKELAEVRKEAARDRAEMQAKIDALINKLTDERQLAQQREFEARIATLTAQNQRPQTDVFDKVVALMPLFQTWVSSGREKEVAAGNQQMRFLELMAASTKKDENGGSLAMIRELAPVLTPFLIKMFDSRGPEAQAKLIEQMSEQQLTFLGMAAQLVQSQIEAEAEAEGAKGKLIPVLEQVLGGAMQLGQAWLQGKQFDELEQMPPQLRRMKLEAMGVDADSIKSIEAQIELKAQATMQRQQPFRQMMDNVTRQPAAPPAPPAPVQQAVAPAPDVVHQAEVVEEVTPDEAARIRRADILVQQQLKNPLVPASFKTNEWSRILVLVHAQINVDEVANELAEHCDNLADAGELPEQLITFHENPRATLVRLFAFMPIQKQAPNYVKALLDAVDKLYEDTQAPVDDAVTTAPTPNLEPAAFG